jgi:hypothetical protein
MTEEDDAATDEDRDPDQDAHIRENKAPEGGCGSWS